MVSVYLDQNKWIDLSRAKHGREDGEKFRAAYDVARHSAQQGFASFPLAVARYIETWRRGDPGSRRRLAETMMELSRGLTMATPPQLCDNELDALLAGISGAAPPASKPVYGWSFNHIAQLIPDLTESQVNLEHELGHLAQRPHGFSDYSNGHRGFGDLYSAGEQNLAANSGDYDEVPGGRDAVVAASAVVEIHENITAALTRAGLQPDALGPAGLVAQTAESPPPELLAALLSSARQFIAMLPTRDAALTLRLLRHEDPNYKWKPNDMFDISAIACAVVHCDIVVTEREWVHYLNRSDLLERHNTQAVHDVAELPEVLIGAVGAG